MKHSDPSDALSVGAQFYDLIERDRTRCRIAGIVTQVPKPEVGILDVGAGTGLPTLVMADAWPNVPISAVEPSRSMRISLIAKIARSDDLRSRVTVHPVPLEEFESRPRFDLVTAFWSLNMIDPQRREAAVEAVSRALIPGGHLVTESAVGDNRRREPSSDRYDGQVRLGDHRIDYSGHIVRHPDGSGRGVFAYTWLDENGQILYEDSDDYSYAPQPPEVDFDALFSQAGLVPERQLDDPARDGAHLTLWLKPHE